MAEYLGNDVTASWNGQALGEVAEIGDVDITRETADASIYNASDYFKKRIATLFEMGEVSITCNFDPADTDGQVAYNTDFFAGTERTLLLTYPAAMGVTLSVTCIPVGLGISQPKEDKISFTIRVQPQGKPSLTFATSTGLTDPYFAVSESGKISPNPAGDKYEYGIVFGTAVEIFTITPTAAAGTIVIEANGASQTVNSGAASSAITLGDADSIIEVTITVTETSKAPLVYTLHCIREAVA